jgi:fatty-acyl-CoA synthase
MHGPLAHAEATAALDQVEMDVLLVVAVRVGSEDGVEACARARARGQPNFPGDGAVGQVDDLAVGELERPHVERVGNAVFAELGPLQAVAAAAIVGGGRDNGAQRRSSDVRQRDQVIADPTDDLLGHAALQISGWLQGYRATGPGHDRFKPNGVVGAAPVRSGDGWEGLYGRDSLGKSLQTGCSFGRRRLGRRGGEGRFMGRGRRRRTGARPRYGLGQLQRRPGECGRRPGSARGRCGGRPAAPGPNRRCGPKKSHYLHETALPPKRIASTGSRSKSLGRPQISGSGPKLAGGRSMLGLMQDWPLLCHRIIDHAAIQHGNREIVSRSVEGPLHRTTFREARLRALKVAQRLQREGIKEGDRVATVAWNTWRHLETWYGITGAGAVYHTINPRLFPEQIAYIMNHAEDRLAFVDLTFVPLFEKLQDKLPTVERYVVLTDAAHMPQTSLRNAVAYEDWIAEADGDFRWVSLDENAACGMCYTSGTTGNPKGVVYSHRSNVLHSMMAAAPDAFDLSVQDTIMPAVPFFHANGWSIAFTAPMVGCKLVLPGAKLDGASLYDLLEGEGVTMTAAVPTIWLMLLTHMEANNFKLSTLRRVLIGGSACPPAMIEKFEKAYGVTVAHAWGMTEMNPIGSICAIKPDYDAQDWGKLLEVKSKQGAAPFTVEMKIVDDADKELPWDGKTFGRLKVRGVAVAKSYFKGEGGQILDEDGYFDTGDVATIDPYGNMQITDRAKDVIKSGGEWISSIDIENLAVGHPKVAEAAVIGIRHPKWDERPLLVIVLKKDQAASKEEILEFMQGKIAKWWMPDDVAFVDEIPHTATGKIQKITLREQFQNYALPTATAAE